MYSEKILIYIRVLCICNLLTFHQKSHGMILSRSQFIVVLLLIFIGPLILYKVNWIGQARHSTGVMWYEGHTLDPQGITSYPVILFEVNHQKFYFNGNLDIEIKEGQSVSLLYQERNPWDAKIDSFAALWLDTIVYMLLPLGIILVIALTPEKLNPLIPRNCSIRLGIRPIIKLIPRVLLIGSQTEHQTEL